MKNLKLETGKSLRITTPQGIIVIEATDERVVVGPNLHEERKPPQTLFYVTYPNGTSTKVLDLTNLAEGGA